MPTAHELKKALEDHQLVRLARPGNPTGWVERILVGENRAVINLRINLEDRGKVPEKTTVSFDEIEILSGH